MIINKVPGAVFVCVFAFIHRISPQIQRCPLVCNGIALYLVPVIQPAMPIFSPPLCVSQDYQNPGLQWNVVLPVTGCSTTLCPCCGARWEKGNVMWATNTVWSIFVQKLAVSGCSPIPSFLPITFGENCALARSLAWPCLLSLALSWPCPPSLALCLHLHSGTHSPHPLEQQRILAS